jgi:hypothetical protein
MWDLGWLGYAGDIPAFRRHACAVQPEVIHMSVEVGYADIERQQNRARSVATEW